MIGQDLPSTLCISHEVPFSTSISLWYAIDQRCGPPRWHVEVRAQQCVESLDAAFCRASYCDRAAPDSIIIGLDSLSPSQESSLFYRHLVLLLIERADVKSTCRQGINRLEIDIWMYDRRWGTCRLWVMLLLLPLKLIDFNSYPIAIHTSPWQPPMLYLSNIDHPPAFPHRGRL